MMKTEILSMHIVDDDGETVLAKIECFDAHSASIKIDSVYTLAEWRELAEKIDKGMVALELEVNEP